jgi:thioredoxin 1
MVEEISSEQQFAEVLKNNKYVLVDFWAPWCGPCRMVAPVIDKISSTYSGSVKVVKVNVDMLPLLARQFNIMGIPSLIFFENGKPKEKVVGALPYEAIESFIKKNSK